MKLYVIHDSSGNIVAAARLDGDTVPHDLPRPRMLPVAKQDQMAAEVFVPTEHACLDFAAVCQRMRVDMKAKFPTLKLKD